MAVEIMSSNALLLWSGKKRFEYKYKSVIFITLLQSILNPLVAYIFVINSNEKGYARILGEALVVIATCSILWFYNLYKGRYLYNKEFWKYALGFNIPLLAYYLSQVIFNQSDRIMISHMIGTDKAAIYGVAYSLATILTFVLNAINNSYLPWFYGKIKEGNEEANKTISLGIAIIMMLLLSGVIWFAPEIIIVLAGNKYAEAMYVVPPVAFSIFLLFYSQLFINVEFFYEEKKSLVKASIGAAIVNFVLNWICIKAFGYVAAAYTTLLSYFIFMISNFLSMKKLLAEKKIEDKAYDYKKLIIVLIAFALTTIIGALLYKMMFIRVLFAVIVLGIMIIEKKQFVEIYRSIKK